MAGSLAPVIKQQFFDDNGDPLAGGKIYSYQAGTTTPQATYTDSTLGTPNANPVVLDAAGRAAIWFSPSLSYKIVVKNSSDVTQYTTDSIIGLLTNDAVPTAALQDSAVTTAKIADDAVTAAKLKDSASTDADRAVTTDHIRDSAVTLAKLAAAVDSSADIMGVGISASVGSNALTIALKTYSGSDPSSTTPCGITFRSSTAATGTFARRTVTAALSVVVSNTSSLGHSSGGTHYIYVYAIDNAGTVELAVSSARFDDGSIVSTTAEGGSGLADSSHIMYSTTARTNVACRLIGRIKSSQATAGVWASAPTEISLVPFDKPAVAGRATTGVISLGTGAEANIDISGATYDTHNSFNTTNESFTLPKTGKFRIGINASIPSAASGIYYAGYKVNGGSTVELARVPFNSGTDQRVFCGDEISGSASDAITFRHFQNTGSSQNVNLIITVSEIPDV